jgi:hypothetical protein
MEPIIFAEDQGCTHCAPTQTCIRIHSHPFASSHGSASDPGTAYISRALRKGSSIANRAMAVGLHKWAGE